MKKFLYNGRSLVVYLSPTIGAFRLEVWENGHKVNKGEIMATQSEINCDSDAVMQWVVDEVIEGRIPLIPETPHPNQREERT